MSNNECGLHRKNQYDSSNNTCFSLNELKEIGQYYNNAIENNIIKGQLINISDNKKKLLHDLNNRLKSCKGNQVCFIKQKFILNSNKFNNVFKPQGTSGRFDWLSTTDINKVMVQIELKYPQFKFGGAVPRDILKINYPFMNSELNIKDLELKHLLDMKKNILAYIYNLDESWQSGSHWVALYCNIKTCEIYFFDSYGLRPHKDIRQMTRKLANFCYHYHNTNCVSKCKQLDISDSFMMNNKKNKLEKQLGGNITWNRNRHQYKNTECGVYSMNFVIKLLEGKLFNELTEKIISDNKINLERDKLFIQSNS